MIEFFQNTFVEEDPIIPNCQHENTYINDFRLRVCSTCGRVFETLDFTDECNWYNRDQSWCNGWSYKPKNVVRNVFATHRIDISSMMMRVIENKYKKICKTEDKKVVRGKIRESIIATCLFYTYQEFGEFRPAAYIRNLFNVDKRHMSQAITKYIKAFPETRTDYITPEKLLPWVMKLAEVDCSLYQRILKLCRFLENATKRINRSCPQSVAVAIIYFYLCLNQDLKKSTWYHKE